MRFAIGIPTINRADLLNEALEKYFFDFPNAEILILDNGNQDIIKRKENFKIFRTNKNFGVAKSWNFLCRQAYKTVDYILMLNDDIYLGKNQKDIYKFIKRTSFDLVHGEKHLCSYILPKRIFKEFVFDENFYPAYFEDNDFKYRLLLEKKKIKSSSFLNPEIYRNSQTIMKDRTLNNNFMDNQEYYIKKWGGLPNEEKYLKPFNV
jgi:GT2 family glycosyltransferase